MKILFLVPYPLKEAPSQRFRFEQYFEVLQKSGYQYQVQSFLNHDNWRLFFTPGNVIAKTLALFKGFIKRVLVLLQIPSYDFVFIHREVTPIGPPVFEWLISKVFRKKIIYDFDDAIWLTDRVAEPTLLRLLKWRSKVRLICTWSYKVSCGNEYLSSYANQFNDHVVYNPTTLDTGKLHNPDIYKQNPDDITIGWTGSHSTLKYLNYVEPVIQEIEKKFPLVRFIVIADRPAELNIKSLKFIPWSLQNEIADLSQITIGVMPLPDDEWSKGKCGFKVLQYMSLQIPVVASPVGVNLEIVNHGINGFFATSHEDWVQHLTQLIVNKPLRELMEKNGRDKVVKDYSLSANAQNFLQLFTDLK